MKRLLLLIATIISLTAKAQTSVYHPFPEDSATWVSDNWSNMCLGYCGSSFYEMKGDTIINSQSYNKIYTRGGQFYYIVTPPNSIVGASFSACSYTGAVRQDSISKKVFYIDSTMTTDTLFYDFDLTVGDTIQSWYNRVGIPWPMVVSGIDSVLIDNSFHKLFNFINLPNNWCCSLIEGVGWSGDLFGFVWSGDHGSNLACFDGNFINGGNFMGGEAFDDECTVLLDCSISLDINEQIKKKHLNLFPNPFSDKLNFTINNQERLEIILYDISSRKLLQTKFVRTITLNTEQLVKGIYFYEVKNKDGYSIKGKVVKD